MKKNQPAAAHKQNLVDKAVQYLTREILADRLRPNQRISELAICKQLGIPNRVIPNSSQMATSLMRWLGRSRSARISRVRY